MAEPTEPLSLNSLDREYIFLTFAFTECGRAKAALDEVDRLASLKRLDENSGVEIREWLGVFDHIRMALHFSASVSRIFFPPNSLNPEKTLVAKRRAKRLRSMTGIQENHALRSRKLRDHVEHMDERMDAWTSNSPRPFGGAVEMIIYADDFKVSRDAVEASCPIIFYPESRVVVAFEEKFDLSELRAVLDDICARLGTGMEAYQQEKRGLQNGGD